MRDLSIPAPQFKHYRVTGKNKILLLVAFLFVATSSIFTQGNGIADIAKAANMITSHFDPRMELVYATGAVVGFIGGIGVYNKLLNGDPDTSKTVTGWFDTCIFLVVTATILRFFFL